MSAVGTAGNPEGEREGANCKFDLGETGSNLALRAGHDGGPTLVVTRRVQRLMAVDIVTIDERFVLQGVLDLKGWRLEERPLSLAILASRHSMPSMVSANSR